MTLTDKLRKAIVTLLYCTTEAKAKKCGERINTIIDDIEHEIESKDVALALWEELYRKERGG